MKWLTALAAFFMLAACAAPSDTPPREGDTAVQAQSLCGPRLAFVEWLKDNYSEVPAEHGLTNANDMLVEVFASKDGETWTLLLTYPDGRSCLITAGQHWRKTMPKLLKSTGLPT